MKTKGKLKNNFLLKAHTEPGKQAMVIPINEKSGKNFLAHISLALTLACLFPQWLSNFFSVNVQFITLQGAVASICL